MVSARAHQQGRSLAGAAPIFLNCFSRGGSNILWNLFLSHPQTCSPIHETLVIFGTSWRRPTISGIAFAALSGQPRFFDQWFLGERRLLNRRAARLMDATLARWKMKTLTDDEMRFKTENEIYTADEVEACRLVAKHNNGLSFLTDPLLAVYPDATFFALTRHPLALYESHRRRGITAGPEQFVAFFNSLASKMFADASRLHDYYLVRFEDIVEHPWESAQRVQALAGLDPQACPKLRFKAKGHFRADGTYGSDLAEGRHHWMGRAQAARFFEASINRIQEERLDAAERRAVLEGTAKARSALGYD